MSTHRSDSRKIRMAGSIPWRKSTGLKNVDQETAMRISVISSNTTFSIISCEKLDFTEILKVLYRSKEREMASLRDRILSFSLCFSLLSAFLFSLRTTFMNYRTSDVRDIQSYLCG